MRCAIVTGAGAGIGRAAALKLAGMGYAVALVGRTVEKLEEVAGEVKALGGEALVVKGDVAVEGEVSEAVAKTVERFGRVDVLVNNAGYAPLVRLKSLDTSEWRKILDTNLSAAFYATRAVWGVMEGQFRKEGAGGVIVNISSMSSKDPFMGLGAYGVAKAGLNMLTLVSAREGSEVGIRAVGIAPGAVRTEMYRKLVGQLGMEEGEVMLPEDVAEVVAEAISGGLRWSSGETVFVRNGAA